MNVIILMRLLTLLRNMVSSARPLSLCSHVQQAVAQPLMVVIATVLLLGCSWRFRVDRLIHAFICGCFVCTCMQRFLGVTVPSSPRVQW